MDAKLKDMAEYIVIAIHEFAKRHQLEEKQAYRYLNHYKAIALCQRHGGALV